MRYNIIRNYIRIISFPYRERRQAAKGGVPMKKNRWQQLKYDNENKQWKLEPENQETLEEIIRFDQYGPGSRKKRRKIKNPAG